MVTPAPGGERWRGDLQLRKRQEGLAGGEGRAGLCCPSLHCRRRAESGWPRAGAPAAGRRAPPGPAASRGPPWPPGPPGSAGRPCHPAHRSWMSAAGRRGPAPVDTLHSAVSQTTKPWCLLHVIERQLPGHLHASVHIPAQSIQVFCPSHGQGAGGWLTLLGEPEATLARPRSASRRTLAHVSFCRATRLSSSDSRSIRSLTTLLLRSWRHR